ncbi:MAG: phosphoribosylaminoimidazolesuccinocarboxamide synthase [Halobacteriaceae archaeon]
MTSVKDIHVDEAPDGGLGRGRFYFTDDYSVFDWGKMPDQIPRKGATLCTMGAFNFEMLEAEGVPTHYRGVVDDGETVPLAEADAAPREMAIDLVDVPELPHDGRDYDYEAFHEAAGDAVVVPMEVVFRNTVPVGSSLRRRSDPADHGLDYDEWPDEAVDLDDPIVEFSTKFEDGDRYLDAGEAERVAGPADVDDIARVAREVNRLLTDRAAERGFVHQDGKIEVLFVDGEIRVADVVGTFDENRFAYDGTQVSKEVIRQHYRATDPDWVDAVSAAKEEATERDVADWKSLCDEAPGPLPDDVLTAVSDLYAAGTNRYTGTDWFDAPPMDEAVAAVEDL